MIMRALNSLLEAFNNNEFDCSIMVVNDDADIVFNATCGYLPFSEIQYMSCYDDIKNLSIVNMAIQDKGLNLLLLNKATT